MNFGNTKESNNLAKGVRKVACSLATIASHKVAEVTQAPMAGPLAPIMIGLGQSRNWSNTARLLLDHCHSSFRQISHTDLVKIILCSVLGCMG